MELFNNVYQGKKVLVTGNTGFKGSWLSIWLNMLGAKNYGLSIDIPTKPSHYESAKLDGILTQNYVDVRDFAAVKKVIDTVRPDFVFHLAAQPIVRDSYTSPRETIETNIIGTTNILEALRVLNKKCSAVIITSDKCYDNVEWVWGYKETDALGGEDPYSASKGGAELMVKTYAVSFFNKPDSNVKVCSARAGNVIGGGDWANARIVPDAIKAIDDNEILKIRSPKATRPWQHVLEPLSGYLLLGQRLFNNLTLCGEAFNFGPKSEQNYTVETLLQSMKERWAEINWEIEGDQTNFKEAGLLKLNCDKALFHLNWLPNLDFDQTVEFVVNWYRNFLSGDEVVLEYSKQQIEKYVNIANKNQLEWAKQI
jgi:CDP-glucose 4,6-dehydratase